MINLEFVGKSFKSFKLPLQLFIKVYLFDASKNQINSTKGTSNITLDIFFQGV